MSKLFVGAGKAEISLPQPLLPDREGFTRILGQLHVRVVLLGSEMKAAIVSLGLTSMMGGNEEIKELVACITGAQYVWVTVSHTFSAPHIMLSQPGDREEPQMSPEEQKVGRAQGEALLNAVEQAALQTAGTLQEAKMHFAYGTSSENTGRDVETSEGWWLGEGSLLHVERKSEGIEIKNRLGDELGQAVLDAREKSQKWRWMKKFTG